ncbi:MAG TPA: aldo/keto reductase [Candidatus Sulfomarinibacteraceae bacterium]|nr:aldo/keto reductase [Candidatus Sulfomarinibacteraceae bacterium]
MSEQIAKEELEKRVLGKSGISIREVGMGLWAAGDDSWGPTDEQAVLDAIDAALDAGVNFFDTADVYGAGHSEELLGRAMQGRRDQFVVATKIGWQNFDEERDQTQYTTVDKLIAGVESNLRRLNTDYVDLLQSHISYREPTMEIFLEGFQRLQEQGKIRAYGVSTSDFDYFKTFNQDGGCASLQIDYSILNRTPEAKIFPYCQEHDIGILIRGPLAMGILTGKFDKDTTFGPDDWRRRWIENEDEHAIFQGDLAKVEQLEPLAEGRSLAQLALQFALAHPAVTSIIPGAKNVDQLTENIQAGVLPPLTAAEMAQIDAITPPGGGRKIWPA